MHSIFTIWPVDSLSFTVRKYNFFRRSLELPRPIFQENLNFQKFGHRTILLSSNDIHTHGIYTIVTLVW